GPARIHRIRSVHTRISAHMKTERTHPDRLFWRIFAAVFFLVIFVPTAKAEAPKQAPVQLAAAFQLPQLPNVGSQLQNLTGPSADWRQWDSFFTFIVKRFGQDL